MSPPTDWTTSTSPCRGTVRVIKAWREPGAHVLRLRDRVRLVAEVLLVVLALALLVTATAIVLLVSGMAILQ
jgi:hypothetical protein